MNLFNLFGTGNDLNTGTFLTLNGKRAKDSIKDFRKAFSEANLLGGTKKGILFSWLTGNFNNDYDLAKDLDNDVVALQAFMSEVKKGKDPTDAINDNLKNASVILQDFVAHTDKANISVQNFFNSVTGAGKLTNAIKGIGLQMLTTAAQAAAIWAITEGFRLVANAIKDYINRAEIAKEKMENSKKAYRFTMTSTNFGSNSMPRHTWSVFSPVISVEPLPRNGSRTMPLVMVEFRIGYWQKLRIITCVKETQKKAGGFSGDSVPNFTTQKQTKKSTLRGKLSKCSFRKQSAN